jgi:hypothetical protein
MVTINPGFTYTDTDGLPNSTATVDNLHTLVDGALATSFDEGEFGFTTRLVRVASTYPSLATLSEGWLWYDQTNDTLRQNNRGDTWDDLQGTIEPKNETGATIPQGSVLTFEVPFVDEDQIELSEFDAHPEVIGVAAATAADGERLFLVDSPGMFPVRVLGPLRPSDLLVASKPAVIRGLAAAATLSGNFGGQYTGSRAIGLSMVSIATGHTALVTCFVWR